MATYSNGKPLILTSSERKAIEKMFEELGIKQAPPERRTSGYTITPLIRYSKSTLEMLKRKAERSKEKGAENDAAEE